jgi:hypothetical protein
VEPEGSLFYLQNPATFSYPEPDQSIPRAPDFVSWRYILILSSYLCPTVPSDIFFPGCHALFFSLIHATCPSHLILLYLNAAIFGVQYRSWNFSLCSLLHSHVTNLFPPCPIIFLGILFWNTSIFWKQICNRAWYLDCVSVARILINLTMRYVKPGKSHVKYSRFYARLQNCEKRLLASSCLSVRPSVRMEQLGSYWTDFHEIWYLSIFRKSVEKIQVSLKSDKNNGYLLKSYVICDNISLISSYKERYFRRSCIESQNKHCVINSYFPLIVPFTR